MGNILFMIIFSIIIIFYILVTYINNLNTTIIYISTVLGTVLGKNMVSPDYEDNTKTFYYSS